MIAPFPVTGAGNRTVFELWLETCRLPALKPGDWVIVDHATFHQGGRIVQLIAAVGAPVVDLPPSSPDLNRLEKCWTWLKRRIRKQLRSTDSWHDAMNAVLKQAAS